MAFTTEKLNDPSGLLFLMFLVLPLTVTANIDCNGKPFHCVNSTHFMICVDLGSGVSSTIDNFVIPCPFPTVCQGNNRFECEFPTVPTKAPKPLETVTVHTTNIAQATEASQTTDVTSQATILSSETETIPFEDFYNTLSTTTLSHNEVTPLIALSTTDSSATNVFESSNIATFGSHANLETDGISATQILTTETQITETELLKTSTNTPEIAPLQTSETVTVSTTPATETSTYIDTITTPIKTNTLEITTNIPLIGVQSNASQSTPLNDQSKICNATYEVKSITSNGNVTFNEVVPTEKIQLATDVVNNVNFTELYETTQIAVESSINVTDSTVLVSEPKSEIPAIEIKATMVGFVNTVDVLNNQTEPYTDPSTEVNQVTVSTLSSSTDSITVSETIITTDAISLLPSYTPTTESNILIENISPTVNVRNVSLTVLTNTADLTSVSTPLEGTHRILDELKTTETLLTTNDLTTSTGEVIVTESNTIYDTSVSTPSSVDLMEFTSANSEITATNKIVSESTSQFATDYNVTEGVVTNSDDKYVTHTTESLVMDLSTAYIHNNKSTNLELKDQIQNETLSVANVIKPTETFVTDVESNSGAFNFTTQALDVINDTMQHTPLAEVNNTTRLVEVLETTSKTVVFKDGNHKVYENTESIIIDNENIKKTKQKPELNATIRQPAENQISETMPPAEQQLQITIAKKFENSKTVTDIESSTISSQSILTSSNSNVSVSDVNNNSVSLNFNSQSTSNYAILNSNSSKTTIKDDVISNTEFSTLSTVVTPVTISQNSKIPIDLVTESSTRETDYPKISFVANIENNSDGIPIVTIATRNGNNTRPIDSLLSTDPYIPIVNDTKQSKTLSPQFLDLTTEVNVSNDQKKINIENHKNVQIKTVNNHINSQVPVKFVHDNSLNIDQANKVNNVLEQDMRIVPLKENSSVGLDNVSPMTYSEKSSQNMEPVQSPSVTSTKVIFKKISSDPKEVNVFHKCPYINNKNHLNSTKNQGVESTSASSVTDAKISIELSKVNENSSISFEQKPNVVNSATLASKSSNSERSDILNSSPNSKNKLVSDYIKRSIGNTNVVSNSNDPTEIIYSIAMASPPKQQDETFIKDSIAKSEEKIIKKTNGNISDLELSITPNIEKVDIKLKNENLFETQKEKNTVNIKSNCTGQSSSKVVALPDITPTSNTISPKIFVQPAKPNDATSTPFSQLFNSSANNYNIFNVDNLTTLPSNQSNKETNTTLYIRKIPRNVPLQKNAESLIKTNVVGSSNNTMEVSHSSVVSIPSYRQDDILKTNTKGKFFKDEVNLNKKPTKYLSDIEQDMPTINNNQVEVEKLDIEKTFNTNNEYKTTNVKPNDNKVTILTILFRKPSNIEEAGKTELTKENVKDLFKDPNILEDNGKNTVEKTKLTDEIETDQAKEVAESDIKNKSQLTKQIETVVRAPLSSISHTILAKVTSKNINISTPRPPIKIAKPVENKFLCKPDLRGRFADNHDCRKFYICIGKPQPMEGMCPINTVFSEIRKQCTKNLSHCVRNNQFQCVSEGRFSDFLNDNFYYICVRNKFYQFIRFKLRCNNGYHLNKTSVQCILNTDNSQSISVSSDKSISDHSGALASLKKKKDSGEFECKKVGKFPDPNDCRSYYICKVTNGSDFRRKKKKCDSDEYFHNRKKRCVDAESYECNS